MNRSFWAVFVIMLGIASIFFIVFFQGITNTDEHNSQMLKEVTEAAMWDAVDYSHYRQTGSIKINKEKFVENFIRRFSESASLSRSYRIEFLDVNETPPKVSNRIRSDVTGNVVATIGEGIDEDANDFTTTNRIDSILETPY